MAAEKLVVPIDFSKSSLAALRYAHRLAKTQRRYSLILIHVITESAASVPFYLREKFYSELKSSARKRIAALLKRRSIVLSGRDIIVIQAADSARAIARQAKKSRASMIIMGSQGRTGLQRFVVGSVAEKTLRYAPCPVLIVKS